MFLTTLVITFSDYSHSVLQPYVTSAFKKHSFMSAAHVVINITRIVAYPIIAKLSDVRNTLMGGRQQNASSSYTMLTPEPKPSGIWPRRNVYPVYRLPDAELHRLCHERRHWSLLCGNPPLISNHPLNAPTPTYHQGDGCANMLTPYLIQPGRRTI